MDIKNLKYSHELFLRKIELRKEIKKVKMQMDTNQKHCDHIRISFGFESPSSKLPLVRCLFCGKEDVDDSYPFIDASTYQRRLHSNFGFSTRVENGFSKFQEICIVALEENPSLEKDDLIDRIKLEIRKDEVDNQSHDKLVKRLYNLQ